LQLFLNKKYCEDYMVSLLQVAAFGLRSNKSLSHFTEGFLYWLLIEKIIL